MKIRAKGTKDGKKLSVEIESRESGDFSFLFNGKRDSRLQIDIEVLMLGSVKMGGTYFPETDEEKLYAIMSGYFFDRAPDELYEEGIKFGMEAETEEGVVY